MKKVFEYQAMGDPVFLTNLKKAHDIATTDFGDAIPTYRTVQRHIREKGLWEKEIEWLGGFVSIVKREVL